MSQLRVEKRDGVLLLTLDDPDHRNMLSTPICTALREAVEAAADDVELSAIVVTGAGSAFCAGAPLGDLEAAARGDDAAVQAVYAAFMTVANSPLPTIAAVNGPAVGAGMNLALACDWRIASRTALFDTRFLKIGLHPGGGHGWMLLRAVGWAKASRLLLGGATLDGAAALEAGLVEAVVEPDGLVEAALAMAAPMRKVPRELLLRTKVSLRLAATSGHAEALAHETAEQAWSLGQPAFAQLIENARRK